MKKAISVLSKAVKASPIALAAALLCGAGAGVAHAGETIEFGDGYKLDWRVNANYTLGQRMKSADPLLAGNAAGNDGNNNFAKNSFTTNRLSLLFESKLSKGDSGFVLSGSTFYDEVYHNTNDNTGRLISKPGPANRFTAETKRFHGGYSRFLDAYAYTSFNFGESSRATVRVGRQVVNWGEATYFGNISQAQGPFDGTKSGVPGTEIKDSVLPEDQIAVSLELTPRFTLLGQVQYGFHETIVQAPGSFMSTSDGVGPGGSCLGVYANNSCMGLSRGADIKPSKTGQWGIGSRYRLTDETEAGLYYLNYNDRNPSVVPGRGTYQVRYFDDVKMLATTVSTTFGNTSAYLEASYRKGAPLINGMGTPVRANVTQVNIGNLTNLGRTPIADSMTLIGEIAGTKYSGYEGSKRALSFKTDSGVAISGTLVLGYPGIFEGWDLTVPISYSQQIVGRTLVGTSLNGEGDKRYSLGATFVRRGNTSVNVTYLGYLGSASLDATRNRLVTDRDQLSLNLKHSF